MTLARGARLRQVVPRWRPWRVTARLGEAEGRRVSVEVSAPGLDALLAEFEECPTPGRLGDLLGAAEVQADCCPEVLAIAAAHASDDITVLGWLARAMTESHDNVRARLFDVEQIDSQRRVARLRQIVRKEPRNSVRWVDLAREYANLGLDQKSRRAIDIALHLAPNDRFALRSAAALYVHLGDLDRAVALLRSCKRTREDPWLLASMIAIGDLAHSRGWRHRDALLLLDDRNFPDTHLAELAAALGTAEMGAGAERKGRQLLRRSVTAPTENTLAQVEWISEEREPIAERVPLSAPRAFEAAARRAVHEGSWSDAVVHAKSWLMDQPFSAQPAMYGSFCACEAEDWDAARDFVREGQRANPLEAGLLNNLAFAEIGAGRLRDAAIGLTSARAMEANTERRIVLAATEALFLYRVGMLAEGRRRYQAVVNVCLKTHRHDHAAKAALMLAREELLAGTEEADLLWKRADRLARDSRRADIRGLHEKINVLLATAVPGPQNAVDMSGTELEDLRILASPLMADSRGFNDDVDALIRA